MDADLDRNPQLAGQGSRVAGQGSQVAGQGSRVGPHRSGAAGTTQPTGARPAPASFPSAAVLGWLLAVGAAGTVACSDETRNRVLPELAALPEFSLIDHRGETFERSDLHGQLAVVSFVFTRCRTICPMITLRTKALRRRLQERHAEAKNGKPMPLSLLSITVDPDFDTPEVLRAYRQQHSVAEGGTAQPIDWIHLTGDSSRVQELVVKGFRTALGEPEESASGLEILHSSHFVLVDTKATIRGYFRSDPDGLNELLAAVGSLSRN